MTEPHPPSDRPAAATPGVEIGVLGPCVVRVDGTVTDLSPVARRVMARLALAAPRPVTSDGLEEVIWGEDRPASARASLANQLSRLRALAPGSVDTVAVGYRLRAATDVGTVGQLRAQAEQALAHAPDAAFAAADDALARWRGEPFADLTEVDEARAARTRLVRERQTLERIRAEAALAQGRSGWAVAEARRLVAEGPLDESRWGLLARALLRDGRRAEALGSIDRARQALRGVRSGDWGSQLRAVEAEVLGDDGLGMPRRFLGRHRELDQLLEVVAGDGRAVVVGEEGAGRSSLLQALVRTLRRQTGPDRPLVAQARVQDSPGIALAVLDDLLVELGETPDRSQGPLPGFVDSVARAAARGRVVLVVDDLDGAGPTSRAALDAAAGLERTSVVCSVGPEARTVAAGSGVVEVELTPLDPALVADIAVDLLGPARTLSSDDLGWLVEMSGGNPVILECLLEQTQLDAATRAAEGDPLLRELTPSRPLQALVHRRLDRLDAAGRSAVEVAAVAGSGCDAAMVQDQSSVEGLARAVGDGLLDDRAGRLRFRHGALRRAVYADIPVGRRVELHHALALALAAAGETPGAIAQHHLAAADLDPLAAVLAAREAARASTAAGAHAEAARWHQRSLAAADALGPGADRARVEALIGQGDALRLAGDPRHEEVLFEAADLAMARGEADLVGAAAIAQLELGATTATGHLHQRAVALADRAMEVVTDPDQWAQVAGAASLAHSMSGHADRCRTLFLEAEAAARSDAARRLVLPHAELALAHPDDLDLREALALELVDRASRAGDPEAHFEGLMLDHGVALQRGDGDRVRTDLARMSALADEVGQVPRQWCVQICTVGLAVLEDRLDDAERVAEEARAVFDLISPSRAFATHASHLVIIRQAQGRVAELTPLLRRGISDQPGVALWRICLALATADEDPVGAGRHLDESLDALPRDITWFTGHMLGSRAAVRLGDQDLIARCTARLRPHAGVVSWQGSVTDGPAATVLAALALAQGDPVAAADHAEVARGLATSLDAPWLLRDLGEVMDGR